MYIYGYAYNTNPDKPGFRPEKPVHTLAEAHNAIKTKLSGKKVEFLNSESDLDRERAYADGQPTGWIVFKAKLETWALVDMDALGTKKVVRCVGSLAKIKEKARELVETLECEPISKMVFDRTGDNVTADYSVYGKDLRLTGLAIIKVS